MAPNNPSNTNLNNEAPKLSAEGAVKDPETGETQTASEQNAAVENKTPAQKAMEASKAKLSAQNPNPSAVKAPIKKEPEIEPEVESAQSETQPEEFESKIESIEGKMIEGSFRIDVRRGGVLIRIPVPMENSKDIYSIDNAFTILNEAIKVKSKKELEEKFASFLPEGV